MLFIADVAREVLRGTCLSPCISAIARLLRLGLEDQRLDDLVLQAARRSRSASCRRVRRSRRVQLELDGVLAQHAAT
jgi:hypothetical protein